MVSISSNSSVPQKMVLKRILLELEGDNWQWRRRLQCSKDKTNMLELLCCPEDAQVCQGQSEKQNHNEHAVCNMCRVPICRHCSRHFGTGRSHGSSGGNKKAVQIPMALGSNNFWGYAAKIIADNQVLLRSHPSHKKDVPKRKNLKAIGK